MYPKLWIASGLTYPQLIDELVALALERHTRRRRNTAALSAAAHGDEARRAQEREQLGAQVAQAGGRGVQPIARNASGSGGDAGDRGVAERGDQAGVGPAEAARRPSPSAGTLSARSASGTELTRQPRRVTAPADRLTSRIRPSSAGRRTAGRNTARTTASMRSSGSSVAARTAASITTTSSAAGSASTACSSSSLLGNQYRSVCLATPTSAAIDVERHRVDPAQAEQVGGGDEDALAGGGFRGHRSRGDRCSSALYHMVDKIASDDQPNSSPASASPSPAAPDSSVPRSSSACCAACPGASSCCSIRPSKRHDPTERARREIFKNNAFDRLKAELKDAERDRSTR